MDFAPSADDALITQTARDFARRELASQAAARDRDETFPTDALGKLATLGFLGMTVPEAHGGFGAGALSLACVIAEIAEADASVAVTLAVTNMVADTLARHATPALRARVLPGLCSGALAPASFALSEASAGSDAAALRTRARKVDGGYRLDGAKLWITSGDRAGVIIVMARLEGAASDGITAFAVERGAHGLSSGRHERKMGQRGSTTVALTLDDVFVPDDALLGAEGGGMKIALGALDGGRINVAAMATGIGRAAFAAARAQARQRQQFGAALAEFQAVQFMLADDATALDAAWLLTARAAWRKQRGLPATRAAAEAKLFASERAFIVCDHAVQIHGGYGYTREFPVERHFRDVRVTTIYEGTSEIQRLVIARHLLREHENAASGIIDA